MAVQPMKLRFPDVVEKSATGVQPLYSQRLSFDPQSRASVQEGSESASASNPSRKPTLMSAASSQAVLGSLANTSRATTISSVESPSNPIKSLRWPVQASSYVLDLKIDTNITLGRDETMQCIAKVNRYCTRQRSPNNTKNRYKSGTFDRVILTLAPATTANNTESTLDIRQLSTIVGVDGLSAYFQANQMFYHTDFLVRIQGQSTKEPAIAKGSIKRGSFRS